jgi:hypothetical protein
MAKKPRDQRAVIFVLGMHRSGTSALARGVGALGAGLGTRLKAPLPDDNEKGFWEDAELSAINDELLAALGCRWDSLSLIRACFDDGEKLRPFAEKAQRVLGERLAQSPLFAFKDPRTCLTLPFWQASVAALHADDAYVVALRSPASVALSLERRDGFAPFKSELLWFIHNAAALASTEGRRRVFVDFDDLMAEPRKQLARIANGLGDERLALERPDAQSYVHEFLEARLHHHRALPGDAPPERAGFPLASALYLELRAAGRKAVRGAKASPARRWREALRELQPIGEYLEAQDTLARLGKDYQAMCDELARVNGARAREARDAGGELAALYLRAEKAEAAGAQLRAEVERERAAFEQELAAAGRQSAEASTFAESLAARARQAETYAQSLKGDLDAMRASSAEAVKYAESLAAQVKSVESDRDAMRASHDAERAAWQREKGVFESEVVALRRQAAEAAKYAESLSVQAREATAYAESIRLELGGVRETYQTERASWSGSSAEAERYAASLVKRAEEAERYAKALEEELAKVRGPRLAS